MSAPEQEPLQRRCAALEAENDRLRRALQRKEDQEQWQRQAAGNLGSLGWRLFAGVALDRALRAWVQATLEHGQLRPTETADVLAALARRVIRVGAFGLLMALIPSLLLIQQNWLMDTQNDLVRQQNAFFREQNQKISQQLELQSEETWLTRRGALLDALYEPLADCVGEDCPPRASQRARQEALKTLVALERRRGGGGADLSAALLHDVDVSGSSLTGVRLDRAALLRADLSRCDLSEASLGGARLHKAVLDSATLDRANLKQARLPEARLVQASLQEAQLDYANLEGARLTGAKLTGASLRKASLKGADLREADLSGADLSTAELQGARLERARHDNHTRWPRGFTPPRSAPPDKE